MQTFRWILWIFFIVLAIALALQNNTPTPLQLLWTQWNLSLSLLLIVTLGLGFFVGCPDDRDDVAAESQKGRRSSLDTKLGGAGRGLIHRIEARRLVRLPLDDLPMDDSPLDSGKSGHPIASDRFLATFGRQFVSQDHQPGQIAHPMESLAVARIRPPKILHRRRRNRFGSRTDDTPLTNRFGPEPLQPPRSPVSRKEKAGSWQTADSKGFKVIIARRCQAKFIFSPVHDKSGPGPRGPRRPRPPRQV